MILFTLCVAALAASAAASSGYISGREYVYRYYGTVYAGYPDIKPQYAGFAFTSDLHIQSHGNYGVFKLENLKFDRLNQELDDFYNFPYNYRTVPTISEYVTKPFKVYFKNGLITHFQVNREEPDYSVNLKRGLITLFHLNFDQSDSVYAGSDDGYLRKPDATRHYYKVYEDGVLGNCETQYVIEHEPYLHSPENNIVLNVTKSRNYHNCITTPNQVFSTFYGVECAECEMEKAHTLHGAAFYHYDIRGDRHHYVIEHVSTEGEVAYSPYPIEGQTVEVYINRTLHLLQEREFQDEYHVSSNVVTYSSLAYDFHHKHGYKDLVDLKKPHYLYYVYRRKESVNQIGTKLGELISVYDDDTYATQAKESNYPVKFSELVRGFSTLGYDDIDEVYRTYADFPEEGATPEQRRYRTLFYDVLVATGTNPAILYAKYLIQSERVTPEVALHYIQQLQYHVKEITEVLLDEIYRLCEHRYVKDHESLHVACYFTLSNIVYDHCVAQYHPEGGIVPDESTCPKEAADKYFNYLISHLDQSEDEYHKLAYIKAAGNLGVKGALRYLRPYVEGSNRHQHRHLRTTAIYALRHVGRRYPEKVNELLVPLYFNTSEPHELRLAAFNVLLQQNPSLYQLETIGRSLVHEPDHQVRSYVYSTLHSLVNATHPCYQKLAKDIHYVLSILDHYEHHFDEYDYSYSHQFFTSGYEKEYDYGGFSRLAYVASDSGYIPRNFYFALNDYVGGHSFDTFGFGFKQYGLEKFVDKIYGPESEFYKKSFFDYFRRRSSRDVSNVEKELREIKEKLNVAHRDYDPIHGEIFFKYMGNDISFLHFDESTFQSFLKDGVFDIPNLPAKYRQLPQFVHKKFLLAVDKTYLIPSEIGLPIIFDYKQPTYIFYKNKDMKLEVNPSFFPEDRESQEPNDAKVHVDGHFIFDKNLFATMGVVIPFDEITFGAGINRRSTVSLPLKVDLNFDLKQPKLTAKWIPVQPHEIYHFHYEPYTYIDSYSNELPVTNEETYSPLHRREHNHKFEHNYFHDALGLGFRIKGDYENDWNDYGSWFHFLTEKDYRQKFYYLYANPHFEPYHIDITLTPADHDVTNEVLGEFSYIYHGDDNRPQTNKHFSDDGFEEYVRPRSGRKFYTSVVTGEVTAKGQKERKVQGEVTYTHDLKQTYHKFNIYYDRTPFTAEESDHMKVCLSGYLKYPKFDLRKFYELDTIDMDHTVETEVKMHFGKDCKEDKKITIRGKFETTEEQRQLERKRDEADTPEHYNPYSRYYHKCQEERQRGITFGDNCIEYFYLMTNVHKYSFDVQHENLTPRFLNYTYKLGRHAMHLLYDHSDLNVFDVNNPENKLHVEANFSVIYPVMDLRVTKPHSVSHYTHVHMPHYEPFHSYPWYEDAHVKNTLTRHYCTLEGDYIQTFDQVSYTLPPINCYKVLAKDCSPSEHFIVLGTKITHPRFSKALKVFLGKHKVEALPVSDDSDIIIRVDGTKVPVTESEPYFHYVPEYKEPLFYVTHREIYYALHSEHFGVIVEYDGRAISIQVSPYYRAKLCGLCGNYNGRGNDGFDNPDGCVHQDAEAFAYSYTIPTATCTVPRRQNPCSSERETGCTEPRTQVLHVTRGKQAKTCFSTEPVLECSSQCVPRGYVSRTLGFHCLPAKDDSTRSLLRQQQLRVLHEVRKKSRDYESTVDVPEGCHRP